MFLFGIDSLSIVLSLSLEAVRLDFNQAPTSPSCSTALLVKMRIGELTARALLGGLAMDPLDIIPEVSPNPAGLAIRQLSCDPGETFCGDQGCMPTGSVCCVPYVVARNKTVPRSVC